jgi:hypothetical protein
MKKNFSIFAMTIAAVVAFSSCSTASHVEEAQGVNFSNYKTFGWANDNGVKKSGRADNEIVDNNIKNSISMELEKKGWQETDQHPDVLLDYNVMVEKGVKKETEPVYGYPYTGYYLIQDTTITHGGIEWGTTIMLDSSEVITVIMYHLRRVLLL